VNNNARAHWLALDEVEAEVVVDASTADRPMLGRKAEDLPLGFTHVLFLALHYM